MSKPKQYANIPIGYVCIPMDEFLVTYNRNKTLSHDNVELQRKIEDLADQLDSLQDSLESAEADRDSSKNSLLFWVERAKGFEAEIEKLKQENASLRDTVSFYVPKWEDDEQAT